MAFLNQGNMSFTNRQLPSKAQWTCINAFAEDGEDIMIAGNSTTGNTALGPLDAVPLMRLSWKDEQPIILQVYNAPALQGEVQQVIPLKMSEGRKAFLVIGRDRAPVILVNNELPR